MTTYLGKSCSFGLPRVPFVNCGQFMYLVISLLVLRAGCGIWLYQFLIIAYLFTLSDRRHWSISSTAVSSKGSSSRRTPGPFCKRVGKNNSRQMGPFCRKARLQNSFRQETDPFLISTVLQTGRKSCFRRRGPEAPPKEGSGEHKPGRSRFLLPNFPSSEKDGKLRLIIDLSRLNKFLNIQSFSMETANKVRNAIDPKDWAISLDLTDAYLHVPIHVTSRKYLRFCLKGWVFQFRAIPFGLATSPFVFTRLMVAIATHIRVRAIILFPYLDDWLVRNQCRLELIKDKEFTLRLITSLSLIINQEKSELIPSQNCIFIGMEFETQNNIVRVPWDRVQDILCLVSWFQKQVAVTEQECFSHYWGNWVRLLNLWF